ncbi:hypothetical protein [Aeoliella sp. SH292]|uniref:hypothetical protein n=1 Tax=Aeoliella sp. SH292 TaxID=3454464 RepID=UPI003F9494C1
MAAVRDLVQANRSMIAEHAVRGLFELLRDEGLAAERLGKRVVGFLVLHLRTAVRRGIIYHEAGEFHPDCCTIRDYSRDDLVSYLAAALGRTWHTRDQAATTLARYLGFRRTGRHIHAATKSAINAGLRRGVLERDGPHLVRRAR